MPNALTAQGLTIATQQELLANKIAKYKTIYGSDIDLSSNTPDGQIVNITVQDAVDLLELMMSVNNSFDPDNAVGVQVDQRCAINGVFREDGTYSITPIEIVLVKPNLYLYGLDQAEEDIYFIYDNTGNKWLLLQSQLNVGPGTIFCDFRAENAGANITIPNTINIPGSVILGVSSVNNPTTQTVRGINEESDATLKARRTISVSLPSQGYQPGLRAALLNIPGIAFAQVYENKTNSTNADGMPGHSIWVIIDGEPIVLVLGQWISTITYSYGDVVSSGGINYISWKNNNVNNSVTNPLFWGIYNPIVQAMYIRRNAGCDMVGNVFYNVTQKDGTIFTIQYDLVEIQNLFISFTATSINGINPPDIAGIIQKLTSDYILDVYQEVNINQMATIVQDADPNCLVTNAGLSAGIVQIANLSGIAASGTFEFRYNGNNTTAINWNDSAATIQIALRLVAGLSACIVTGSIASQTITITLHVDSALGLITVVSNSLMTSAPSAITFSFNENYQNFLLPNTKKNKFIVNENNIIILPMILSPSSVSIAKLATQQFTGLGGYGTKTYSMQSNPSGGTIDSSTGLYTAGNITDTDIAKVIDSFGNTATATITVQ